MRTKYYGHGITINEKGEYCIRSVFSYRKIDSSRNYMVDITCYLVEQPHHQLFLRVGQTVFSNYDDADNMFYKNFELES